jgi:hypothetical protein
MGCIGTLARCSGCPATAASWLARGRRDGCRGARSQWRAHFDGDDVEKILEKLDSDNKAVL